MVEERGRDDPANDTSAIAERRRPGKRVDTSKPFLLRLFRHPTAPPVVGPQAAGELHDQTTEEHDSLAPVRGILLGLFISLAMWALIGAAVYFLA